jgi:meiotic recombination protein DMC1
MADPGAMSMFKPVIKPVGGHVLTHASTTRVMLKKGKGERRITKIFESPLMPEEEAIFQISNAESTTLLNFNVIKALFVMSIVVWR